MRSFTRTCRAAVILSLCTASSWAATTAEAPPKVALVEAFYSSEEKASEPIVKFLKAFAGKHSKKVKLELHDIAKIAEYRLLRKREKTSQISKFAAVEVFCGGVGLAGKTDITNLLGTVVERVLDPSIGRGTELSSADRLRHAKTIFPGAQPAAGTKAPPSMLALAFGRPSRAGYAVFFNKRISCGVCSDSQFVVGIAAGKVVKVTPIMPIEVNGKPKDGTKFLSQFEGATSKTDLSLGRSIDGITGATKTSRKYIQGIREALIAVAGLEAKDSK